MLFIMKDFFDIKVVLWKILWSFSGIYRVVNECIRILGYINVYWCKKRWCEIFKDEIIDIWKNFF